MIRRSLVLFAALAAVVVLAAPASAAGATTSTQHVHGAFPPMQVGPLCGVGTDGTLYATGNEVFHITINAAGDVWVTTTQEAWFTIVPTDSSAPTYTGHLAIWFGESLNRNNAVLHDVFNVHATGSDGSTISINLVDHMSISASGQVNVFSTCH